MSSLRSPARRWLVPSAEILTVGLPFCVFKLLTGAVLLQSLHLAPLGYALLALGCVDAVLNLVNLVALVVARRAVSGPCLTAVASGRLGRGAELGLAIDMFLSFALVAAVVGFGLVLKIPPWAMPIWNLAVVLNVLGAGGSRLIGALRRERDA